MRKSRKSRRKSIFGFYSSKRDQISKSRKLTSNDIDYQLAIDDDNLNKSSQDDSRSSINESLLNDDAKIYLQKNNDFS